MSHASLPLPTTSGYSPPTATQFSVFLTNKVGRLYDVVQAFESAACQICAISVHEASDHAVVRIITNRQAVARQLLRESGFPFAERDVLIVELSRGHTLGSLCISLLAAELSIQFAYPLMIRPNGTPTIALAVDDMTLAGQILLRKEFRLFGEADLPSLPPGDDE
ncbi:MAG: acetolactate synthase [Planctomycetota bacterium]|nr:acetolactate synthase [Planctomycetota bacterium]